MNNILESGPQSSSKNVKRENGQEDLLLGSNTISEETVYLHYNVKKAMGKLGAVCFKVLMVTETLVFVKA